VLLPAEHELLLKIIEEPDDDPLRRVLADLLTDRGEPWGELIHVQCALERIRTRKGHGEYLALKQRERELLKEHRSRWHQQAAPVARELEFRRGLPEVLHTTAKALLEDGGLTVLAPIRELNLQSVAAAATGPLFTLPLLKRVRGVALLDVDGGALHALPPLPRNVRKLTLVSRDAAVLNMAARSGWFDTIDDLTLSLTDHDPRMLAVLEAAKVAKVTLVGTNASAERAWIRAFRRVLEQRPLMRIGWHGEWYDAQSADDLEVEVAARNLRPLLPLVEVGAGDLPEQMPSNREPFGTPQPVGSLTRDVPGSVKLERLADGGLLATGLSDAFLHDAGFQLALPPDPSRITAVAYSDHRLRYEAWPAMSLAELGLPLPEGLALHVMAAIAEILHFCEWQFDSLSLHDIWVGRDGAVKLLVPLHHTVNYEMPSYTGLEDTKDLGLPGDPVFRCGTALLQLLAGELPVPIIKRQVFSEMVSQLGDVRDRPLLPSMFDAKWEPLDPLVERCLTREHAHRFATPHDVALAAYEHPLFATRDSLAQHVRNRQSSPP
jgi:uncharacterized protein (TIGR02996 family)